ncbi:MAG: hypothetical protein IKH91_10975 [Prevotella sp.]|nr:hypothetical protein [Prevotella sp.]
MRKKITLALLSLLLVPLGMMAQNVTVHPGNGSMLPALKAGQSDTFFGWNGFATWKHEQLSLTLTTGDSDNNSGTDADGQLARPANDIFKSADGTCLQIGKGNSLNTYLTVSLPKGYRFTGYTIQFHRISSPNGASGTINNYNGNINFGETYDNFSYRSTTPTSANNITPYSGNIGINNTDKLTIGRTSTDMENVLYFMLSNGAVNGRAFIQLDFVEFYFTAENNYAPLIPAPNVTEQSAVDIPFTTSKMDYGELKRYTIDGEEVTTGGRVSYNGTIHDMNANLTLYEDGSVKSVTNNGFDGTAGYMVDYKSGSISQAGDYFKLDASKHGNLTANNEAIYYLESPIWAVNSSSANANKNPIGYRIIGADFDYTGGNVKFPAVFKIQYYSSGHGADQDGTYGLNFYNNSLAYNWNYQTEWRIDDDGYIYVGNTYLRETGSGNSRTITTTTTKSQATQFVITTGNQIQVSGTSRYVGWNEDVETHWARVNGQWVEVIDNITRSAITTTSSSYRATYNELSHAFSENIGQYTFNIYDKTGTRVEKTVTVNGTSGTLSIDGLNNDAVKIGVIGTGIIKGHVTLQALDPYIDHIDIVCQEQGTNNGGKLTQQFTATDFSVRGGKFTFYVPEDFTFPAQFTFENLYSKYGDETYYNTPSTNHGRYFFMGSPYGDSNNNVYGRSESASYTTKINCLKPGDKKFTFNNAATATANPGTQYEEYPFSKALYASKVNGQFNDFLFTQDEMTNGTTKTAYLFTCDETRYNIAPTTATQHVYYAFYEMTIDMKKKTYQPVFGWEKVYDKTFYSANNTYKQDAMYGLTVTTESVTDDQGTHSGYVTVSQIKNQIESALTAGGTNVPSSKDQILFIDASNLMNIVENQTTTSGTTTAHKLSELKQGLAANALIYLPYGSTSSDDNFAYNTIAQYGQTPIFRGANNIVLTDKNPFYAKYGIQVDAAKFAKYTRQITKSTYTKEDYATVIMPFTIKFDEGEPGVKTDENYGKFTFLQMNTTAATSDSYYNYGPAVFFGKTSDTQVEANTPYALKVENKGESEDCFTLRQYGSNIVATPAAAKSGNSLFSATEITATGNLNSEEYTFSHKGSFSGYKIPKESPKTFYFANGGFYSSAELKSTYTTVDLLPFRSVYEVLSPVTAKVGFLRLVEGENETSGIDVFKATSAEVDMNAPVYDLQGRMVAPSYREAKGLQNGLYVVNGVKIIVK